LRVVAHDVTSSLDGNCAGFGRFALAHRNQQAAVDVARLHLVRVGLLGQFDDPSERAVEALLRVLPRVPSGNCASQVVRSPAIESKPLSMEISSFPGSTPGANATISIVSSVVPTLI
jgi:hypothetical protein